MRPIHGAAPGISAADHFTAMRDNPALARPHNPSEAVATDDLHVFHAPSRAHIKRIQRGGNGNIPTFVKPELKRYEQIEFYKRMVADLGGTRTIAATDGPRVPQPREPGVVAEPRPLTAEQQELRARQRQAEAERVLIAETLADEGQRDLFA